jgi:hypothetical protein
LQTEQAGDLPGLLLGAYFVFNISYFEKLKPFYLMLEAVMFGRTSEKMPAALRGTLSNLSRAA